MIEYKKGTIKHLDYVEDIYNNLDELTKEKMIKLFIFANIKKEDDDYIISKTLQDCSNRVHRLPKEEAINALMLTEWWLTWTIAQERNIKVVYPETKQAKKLTTT